MMIYLTIISIISIIVAFLSLEFSAKNSNDMTKMFEKHIERLEKEIESDRKFIEFLDGTIQKQKG